MNEDSVWYWGVLIVIVLSFVEYESSRWRNHNIEVEKIRTSQVEPEQS